MRSTEAVPPSLTAQSVNDRRILMEKYLPYILVGAIAVSVLAAIMVNR
jgi:hypothetical protein